MVTTTYLTTPELDARREWKGIARAAKDRAGVTVDRIREKLNSLLGRDNEHGDTVSTLVLHHFFSPPPAGNKKVPRPNVRVPTRAEVCWALIRALDALGGWEGIGADKRATDMRKLTELIDLPPLPLDGGIGVGSDPVARMGTVLGQVQQPAILCVSAMSPPLAARRAQEDFRNVLIRFINDGGSYAIFVQTGNPKELRKKSGSEHYADLLEYHREIWDWTKDLVIELRRGVQPTRRGAVQLVEPRSDATQPRFDWSRLPSPQVGCQQRPALVTYGKEVSEFESNAAVGNWITQLAGGSRFFFTEPPGCRTKRQDLDLTDEGEAGIRRIRGALFDYYRPVLICWRSTKQISLKGTMRNWRFADLPEASTSSRS